MSRKITDPKDRELVRFIIYLVVFLLVAAGGAIAWSATHAAAATTVRKAPAAACTEWKCPAVLTNAAAWDPAVKPAAEYFGNGGAPYVTWHWVAYKHAGATARGTLHAMKAGCQPAYQCRYYKVPVTAVLSRTRYHKADAADGGYYYSRMHLEYATRLKLAASHWFRVSSRGYWDVTRAPAAVLLSASVSKIPALCSGGADDIEDEGYILTSVRSPDPPHHYKVVVGGIYVCVNRDPIAWDADALLETYHCYSPRPGAFTCKWLEDDSQLYGFENLPAPGDGTHPLRPFMRGACPEKFIHRLTARWRIKFDWDGITHSGRPEHGTIWLPEYSNKRPRYGKKLTCEK